MLSDLPSDLTVVYYYIRVVNNPISSLEKRLSEWQSKVSPDQGEIKKLDTERKRIVDEIDSQYNPYFGSLFR